MPASAELMPAEVSRVTCPRCHFTARMVPVAALVFRCSRCEWALALAAPALSAAPAFPATTVTVTSPYPTPVAAAIALNGASVTSFSIGGADAGAATAGTYILPANGTFTAVFTGGPPTWTWALPVTSAGVNAGGTALAFASTGTNTAFTAEQLLIVDPAGTSDVVKVTAGATAASVPVNSLNSAHNSGVSVAVAVLTPFLSSVEAVPATSY